MKIAGNVLSMYFYVELIVESFVTFNQRPAELARVELVARDTESEKRHAAVAAGARPAEAAIREVVGGGWLSVT
jgi:hypothetical protein